MADSPSYKFPAPQKLGERGSTSGRGYDRAQTTRQGVHTQATPPTKEASKMTMQPGPVNPPNFPNESNGFAPDVVISEVEPDAQSAHVEQPPLDMSTDPPEVVPTTATPDAGGESDPTPGAADPGPTGAAERPGYAALIEGSHPIGFPGKAAR
jgi:hypothetical protein